MEGLKHQLLHRRITRGTFSFPLTEQQAYDMLLISVKSEISSRGRVYVENKEQHQQLLQMAKWMSSSDSKPWMLLCGGCGNGKTTMMKAFRDVLGYMEIPHPFDDRTTISMTIHDAMHVINVCKEGYKGFKQLMLIPALGIDDVGIEPYEILDFGNVLSPIVDLITKRYEEQLFTFITTNLTPRDIRERYGERIADRLNEMSEKIIFANSTFRTSVKNVQP